MFDNDPAKYGIPWRGIARPVVRRRRRRVVTRSNSNHARNLVPPAWVEDVVQEVRRVYSVPSKRLLILWRKRAGQCSSGHTKVAAGEIVITAGRDEFDQGDVLLHELAHWLNRKGTAHRLPFWRTYWQLVRHFGLNEGLCLKRQAAYKSKAAVVYEREVRS